MAIRSLIRVSLLGLVLGSLAVSAETWYLIANNAHADNPAAWTVMQYWKTADGTVGTTGEAVSSADDFVVKDGRVLRTGKYGASMTFPGKSLQLGDATTAGTFTHDGGSFTFARDGLTVYGGGIYYTNVGTTNNFLQGTQLRVMATAERPFVFDAQQALYSNSVMHVVAPVVGDAGTCLRFGRDNSVTCRTTHKLDDLTHYQGSIIVGNGKFPCEGECWGNKVLASSFSTPGMLRLADNGAAFGVLTNGTVCTAATVELAAGSRLMVEGAIGLVRATTTLSVAAGARICLGSTLSSSRIAVLEGPIASTFTAGDFVLETLEECANDDIALDVVADEVAGTKTLYLTCSPLVIQIRAVANEGMKDKMKNNVPGTYGSSMTNKSSWNDGELPHAGSAYYSGMSLRTPLGDVSNNTGDWAFPGDGLVLGRGSQFTLFQKNVTIDRLEMRNGGYMQTGQGSWNPVVHVPQGIIVRGEVRLGCYAGQTLTLDGEISGSGNILCWGVDATGAPAGGYAFTGLNTSFLGTICVSQRVVHATARPTLNLYDGRNLGGKLPAFEPRALWLDDNALVYLPSRNSSVTLPHDYNRGLYVRCAAEINVNDTSVLEIKQPILLAGHLGLVAGGRVILGGPMTFEESLGGAVTEVPVADSNVVTVAKGTLVAAHPDCLNGCAVSFAAGTHLELRADLDDANLTRYGIRLTRDLSDVALDSSFAGKLPLTVTCNSARPMRAVVGLITVPAAQAASMREKLPTFAKLWAGTRQTLVEIPDAEAGTVTFALQVVCPGTQLILR